MKLPKGIKKFIRKEKARIRREVFDKKKREEKEEELYLRFKNYRSNKQKT